MEAVDQRLRCISNFIERHMRDEHPIEYQLAQRVDRIG
jgi:hypothetical protein